MADGFEIKFNTPFYKAREAAQRRGVVLPQDYYGKLPKEMRSLANTISYIQSVEQIQTILDDLKKTIDRGDSFQKWRKNFNPKQFGITKAHAETVYRNALQTQYSVGRWEQMWQARKTRPYLRYVTINDSRTSQCCRALSGIIRPIDDPFWNAHTPPNHHRCRSVIVSLTEKEAQKRSPAMVGLNQPQSPEMQPQKGWDYNPALSHQAEMKALAHKKIASLPPVIKLQAEKQFVEKMNIPIAPYRQEWQQDFPKVILNGPLGKASKHPSYQAAKNGDLQSATELVADLLNKDAILKLSEIIADKKPLLVPVHAEESVSINRIPLAYAAAIGREFDLAVEFNVVQSAKVGRTQSDGFGRLAFPPPFSGIPSQKAKHAIIFDDTLTQGGTLANLHGYLAQFGIETIAATTLTGKDYSSVLAITSVTLNELKEKYHELEKWWIDYFGYGFSCLTESEARYIIKSGADADAIRNRIITERQKRLIE